jgi:hypothetical protein
MTVRPTSSGQTPRPGIERAGTPSPPATPTRGGDTPVTSPAVVRRDDVQISPQARQLQQLGTAQRGPAGEIEPGRLREVMGRISSGFYDQPHVKDELLRRIAQDV